MGRIKLFFLCLAVLLSLCLPVYSHAQSPEPEDIAIIHTATTAQDDTLTVSTFFTFQDADGRLVPNNDEAGIQVSSEGTMQLLGMASQPVSATIEAATTPLKIALVLDASGSMGPVMPAVKDAAIRFVAAAPGNAEFAVFHFADSYTQEQSFTSKEEIGLINNAINAIQARPSGTGDTCLYETLYDVISKDFAAAIAQNPEERRAIVVFTDGRDSEAGGSLCGTLGMNQIVEEARQSDRIPIQIHTIGLCANARCNNINQPELLQLANDTRAYPAIASSETADDLDSAFNNILEGLQSQWVIRANLKPPQGENEIDITVQARIRDVNRRFSENATFVSERDYTLAAPGVAIIGRPDYVEATNSYSLSLQITSPQLISEIAIAVSDGEGGITMNSYVVDPGSNTVIIPADGFAAQREYCFGVIARDINGTLIEQDALLTDTDFQEEQCIVHLLKSFGLKATPDRSKGVLTIDLVLGNEETTLLERNQLLYEGDIKDERNVPVQTIEQDLLKTQTIELPLPDAMARTREFQNFVVTVSLIRPGESSPFAQQSVAVPMEPLTFVGRMVAFVRQPVMIGVLVLTGLIIAGVLLLPRLRNRSEAMPHPRAINPATVVISPAQDTTAQRGKAAEQTPREETVRTGPSSPPRADPPDSLSSSQSISQNQVTQDRPPADAPVSMPPVRMPVSAESIPATLPASLHVPSENETALHPAPAAGVRITVVQPARSEQKRTFQISNFPCVVGRRANDPEVHVAITGDDQISRKHIEITVKNGTYYVTDLASRNGTFINDQRLSPHTPHPLVGKTAVRLGHSTHMEMEPYL